MSYDQFTADLVAENGRLTAEVAALRARVAAAERSLTEVVEEELISGRDPARELLAALSTLRTALAAPARPTPTKEDQ